MPRTLDDLDYIRQIDTQDFLGAAAQMGQDWLRNPAADIDLDFNNPNAVLVCGMGGSSQAADLIRTAMQTNAPVLLNRDYDLPSWVDNKTWVILSSFSGNTEEVLSCLKQAKGVTKMLTCASNGGELASTAKSSNIAHVTLPDMAQPRMSLCIGFRILYDLFLKSGTISGSAQFDALAETWAVQSAEYSLQVPTKSNLAKQLALNLMGTTPIIYSGTKLQPIAYLWKTLLNESAKTTAWTGEYPESNHNEFTGWTSQPQSKAFSVIDLRSDNDGPRIEKRFDITAELLSGKRPAPQTVRAKGGDLLSEASYLACLGVHVASYLAIAYGINPTPLAAVDKLKERLG